MDSRDASASKNLKYDYLTHCHVRPISSGTKNLIWGLANVNIKSIANSNQANLANITWSSICVNLQTYIQIQSEFQGYDQLTSVHTMRTLVQIFFCIEGWDKAIMQRRTIYGMPERWMKKFSENGACKSLCILRAACKAHSGKVASRFVAQCTAGPLD